MQVGCKYSLLLCPLVIVFHLKEGGLQKYLRTIPFHCLYQRVHIQLDFHFLPSLYDKYHGLIRGQKPYFEFFYLQRDYKKQKNFF